MNNDYEHFKYTRKRWGRGFQYLELPHHEKVNCEKTISKIKLIVIPPMWQKVLISLDQKAKIVAVGRDAKGRKQYIYSESWQFQQQALKFAKLSAFGEALPNMRELCRKLLDNKNWPLQKVLALMVLVLDETGVRIGNKRYSDENKSYGLSTLRRKHLVLNSDLSDEEADSVFLEYTGKSGKDRQVSIDDSELATHIKQCSQQPGYNIFRYQQSKSNWQDVCSEDVNDFIKQNMGEEFSCKDFRTWTGTCLAVESYWQSLEEKELNKKKKLVNIVIEQVAKQLGNTPAICRDYYIHPLILKRIESGTLGKRVDDNEVSNTQLNAIEKFVLHVIQDKN